MKPTRLETISVSLKRILGTRSIDETFSGKLLEIAAVTGATITLPTPTGSGNVYHFIIGSLLSSGSFVIKVPSSAETFIGTALIVEAADEQGFGAASDSDTLTMNGTTKGGLVGSSINVTDISSTQFLVEYVGIGSGIVVTPFSAAVS